MFLHWTVGSISIKNFKFFLSIITMGSMTVSNQNFQLQSIENSTLDMIPSSKFRAIEMIYDWFGRRRDLLSVANVRNELDSFHLLSTAFTKWEPYIYSYPKKSYVKKRRRSTKNINHVIKIVKIHMAYVTRHGGDSYVLRKSPFYRHHLFVFTVYFIPFSVFN